MKLWGKNRDRRKDLNTAIKPEKTEGLAMEKGAAAPFMKQR